jgi:phosphoglycolate phosphatase-like HAD superfamily hydrolase
MVNSECRRRLDIVVIGDTPYDAKASNRAGLQCIGLLSGGFTVADLETAGCIAVYRDPGDLLANYASCFS